MEDTVFNILEDDYDPIWDTVDPLIMANNRSFIIDCAEFVVNNQDISTEDFLKYWAYYQHSIAKYTLPGALDETLTEFPSDENKTTEIWKNRSMLLQSRDESVTAI